MKKCILTVGVSASGKTTWAEGFVEQKQREGEVWININRDEIRKDIFETMENIPFQWNRWHRKWEKEVYRLWKNQIQDSLQAVNLDGVIISDTNLNPKVREEVVKFYETAGWDVEMKMFPISFEDAVKRDLARKNPVGSHVIAEQIEKYWAQFGDLYQADPSLPAAVVVDIDGTLAHATSRDIYDWSKVHTDSPDEMVCCAVKGYKLQGFKVLIVSGRDCEARELTLQWLIDHLGFEPDGLFMRDHKDYRKDSIVKREIFDYNIRNKYNVKLAIDDRPQVIMGVWKAIGIQTLICGNPYKFF